MAYYTAVYKKDHYGWFTKDNQIWEHNGFSIHQFQGKYCMVKDGYRIAELIETDRLNTTYGGSFVKWIESVRKKDIKKVEKLKEYRKQLTEDIEVIQDIWKKPLGWINEKF